MILVSPSPCNSKAAGWCQSADNDVTATGLPCAVVDPLHDFGDYMVTIW